jgi:hypothetical protein
MLLPQTSRPSCRATSLSYPLLTSAVKSTGPDLRDPGTARDRSNGRGTLIVNPEVRSTQGADFDGGGSPLEGGEALGLSASLWGEQVISYVGSGERANPDRIPGVSRVRALIFRASVRSEARSEGMARCLPPAYRPTMSFGLT